MVRKSGFHVLRSAQKDQAMSAVVCGLPTHTGLHDGLAWQLCALGCNCPQSQRPREVCRRPPSYSQMPAATRREQREGQLGAVSSWVTHGQRLCTEKQRPAASHRLLWSDGHAHGWA